MKGDWEGVRDDLLAEGRTKGKATEIANEIRHFYEADENTLWMTFLAIGCGGRLLDRASSGSQTAARRGTSSANGGVRTSWVTPYPSRRSAVAILQVRRFQGTICSVESSIRKNKINGCRPTAVSEVESALEVVGTAAPSSDPSSNVAGLRTLVDLIFSNAGWQRISVLGKTQKTLDLDLRSPVTGERDGSGEVRVRPSRIHSLSRRVSCRPRISRIFSSLFIRLREISAPHRSFRTRQYFVHLSWCAGPFPQDWYAGCSRRTHDRGAIASNATARPRRTRGNSPSSLPLE